MCIEPRRLVVAGAEIVRALHRGCTPEELLDVLAELGRIPPGDYVELVVGELERG